MKAIEKWPIMGSNPLSNCNKYSWFPQEWFVLCMVTIHATAVADV